MKNSILPKWSLPVLAAGFVMVQPEVGAALVLQYLFDEPSGEAVDTGTVSPAAPGTLGGSATRVTNTPSGSGFAMSTAGGGAASFAAASNPTKLNSLTTFTLAGWVNLQATPGNFDRLLGKVGSNTSATGTGNSGWELFFSSPDAQGSALQLFVGGGATGAATSIASSAFVVGSWAFFAVTYDSTVGSNNVSFYTGSLTDSVSQLGSAQNLNNGVTAANLAEFRVGGSQRSNNERTPDAFFDDIRVYDELLTASQIEAVRLSNVPEPGVVSLAGVVLTVGLLRRRRI